MKILHIINSLSTGGAEKLVADIVPLMQKKGIDADVLLLKDEVTPFRNALEGKSSGKVFGLTKGNIYSPLLIFKIIPHIKKYDIVHLHLFPTLYWTVIAKWLSFSKTKLVYTEHNTDNRRRHHPVLKVIDKLIYKPIQYIITIADEVDRNLKSHLNYKNNDKFVLINNGVDISSLTSVSSLNKDDFFNQSDFLLIQVSSFREQKDQPTLIRAMARLSEDVKLLLVGDGHLRQSCEELVRENNLENRVKFLGNRNDVPQLLKTADVAVLSSHHEGLSLSSIEGMATNPFIASDVQGLREIVDGHGLLFKQGDDKQLAELILKLKNDKVFYEETKVKCQARAMEFDISRMVDGYVGLYGRVMKE